jgi:hypothetical protein
MYCHESHPVDLRHTGDGERQRDNYEILAGAEHCSPPESSSIALLDAARIEYVRDNALIAQATREYRAPYAGVAGTRGQLRGSGIRRVRFDGLREWRSFGGYSNSTGVRHTKRKLHPDADAYGIQYERQAAAIVTDSVDPKRKLTTAANSPGAVGFFLWTHDNYFSPGI